MTIGDHTADNDWPFEWLAIKHVLPYIKRLGPDQVGVELGVARGESSYMILDACPNVKKLYGVDPYMEYLDWNGIIDQEHQDKIKPIAETNMKQFVENGRYEFRLDRSEFAQFEGMSHFDFVFIDGDHSHDGVMKDLEKYYPLLRAGGIFSGHDYNLNTVQNAVGEFRDKHKVRIPINLVDNNSWFWVKM